MEMTKSQQQFLFAFLWETSHLEMNGPAHRVAHEHDVTDVEMALRFSKIPAATADFWHQQLFAGPRIPAPGWPWSDNDFPSCKDSEPNDSGDDE